MEEYGNNKYSYYAFISYCWEDDAMAKWLQKTLEHYKLPVAIREQNPDLPEHIRPIFRDKTDNNGQFLEESLVSALLASRFMIVICSPNATRSSWVQHGIDLFIQNGRQKDIIPFIIAGEPRSENEEKECFPSGLLALRGSDDILGININDLGKDAAAVRVVSRMFDLKFDSLWLRYKREEELRRRKKRIMAALAFMILFCFLIYIGIQNCRLEDRNQLLRDNQARIVAALAKHEIAEGNVYGSILALLEFVPEERTQMNYIGEVEQALRMALDSLTMKKTHNRLVIPGSDTFFKYFPTFIQDGRLFVMGESSKIEIKDSRSLETVLTIPVENDLGYSIEEVEESNILNIYMTDSLLVSYSLSSLEFLSNQKLSANDFLGGKMHVGIRSWIDGWYNIEEQYEVMNYYVPQKYLFLRRLDYVDDNENFYYYYDLLDCAQRRLIMRFDNKGSLYQEDVISLITDCSFSQDGSLFSIATLDGDLFVVNIKEGSLIEGQCIECGHYSNHLSFLEDGKLCHYSRFEPGVSFFDPSTLERIGFCCSPNFGQVGCVSSTKDGKAYLWTSENETFMIYNNENDSCCFEAYNIDSSFCKIERCYYENELLFDNRYELTKRENGIYFHDRKGEYKDWIHYGQYGCTVITRIGNDRIYLVVEKDERLSSTYDIVELCSGITMQELCGSTISYSNKHKCFLVEDYYEKSQVPFYEYHTIIDMCKEKTEGMILDDFQKKIFCLE